MDCRLIVYFSVCSDTSGNIYAAGWFTNSSGNKYVAKYGLATGINETSTADIDVLVYPNPSIGELNVHLSGYNRDKIDRIEIDNVLGKKIYEQTINSNHQTKRRGLFCKIIQWRKKLLQENNC